MRLALIIDDYLPSSTRVGAKMFHELAVELLSLGHEVTVITPVEGQNKKFVQSTLNGVRIWKYSTGRIKDVNKITRAVNETLLSYRAWFAIKSKVLESTFDGIIYYSPSIFFGHLVKKLKERCNCSAYLILRDLFPQWAIDSGFIKEKSVVERYFRFFEKLSYSQASMIGLMSTGNLKIFNDFTDHCYPTQVLRNWASHTNENYCIEYRSLRSDLGLDNKILFFYGGNIGHAQDMSNLMRLVVRMQKHSNAHFIFLGQGDEVNLINKVAKNNNLSNFTFLPSVNQEHFKCILAEMDVGLFSLASGHTSHNFPGKLLGYMVESLPILGSVNIGNDLMELINQNNAGLISVNGDDNILYENTLKLLEDKNARLKLGNNSYQLLSDEFSISNASTFILGCLNKLD